VNGDPAHERGLSSPVDAPQPFEAVHRGLLVHQHPIPLLGAALAQAQVGLAVTMLQTRRTFWTTFAEMTELFCHSIVHVGVNWRWAGALRMEEKEFD
jgi:hypothetical protein